jgi:hypothetical protein
VLNRVLPVVRTLVAATTELVGAEPEPYPVNAGVVVDGTRLAGTVVAEMKAWWPSALNPVDEIKAKLHQGFEGHPVTAPSLGSAWASIAHGGPAPVESTDYSV